MLSIGIASTGVLTLGYFAIASHVLRIPIEEDLAPHGEMTPQALGQLFHKTLELFYSACREQGFPQGDKEVAARLKTAAESCFTEFEAAGRVRAAPDRAPQCHPGRSSALVGADRLPGRTATRW